MLAGRGRGADRRAGRHGQAAGAARAPRSAGAPGGGDRGAKGARGATDGGNVVIRRHGPEAGTNESDELERLCEELGRVEAPFDEISRSRAEARLGAALAREPAWRQRRALGWTAALVVAGAAAAVVLVARTVVPAVRSYAARRPE